jgi:hypothetical protein
MIVRLIPYADIFVHVTFTLDEAAAVEEALTLLRKKNVEAEQLRGELESAMGRANALKEARGY